MGNNKNPRILFNCDNCGNQSSNKPSQYKRKKRHFCSMRCYAKFQSEKMPIEEHGRYGTGHAKEERIKRLKARSTLNHYLRDKNLARPGCEICGEKSEAHHDNYDKPLDVKWLCFKHHREHHKKNNQNPELLK